MPNTNLADLTWDHIDGMVEGDPLKLRDLAWQLVKEIDRLRPVVEAAKAWRAMHLVFGVGAGAAALIAAVDALNEEADD